MKKIFIIIGYTFLMITVFNIRYPSPSHKITFNPIKVATAQTPSPTPVHKLHDTFTRKRVVEEVGSMNKSTDPNWWVNSGGRFIAGDAIGKTIQGDLPTSDPQYIKYASTNPSETDGGLHPQNIFRLVTRGQWTNFRQQVYFMVNRYYTSDSKNRQASNGLFLFNRYVSGQTVYYTGLRVDGKISIKKKYNGTYYDMVNKTYLNGKYDRATNPNLLPLNTWIGLRTNVTTTNNIVTINMYIDYGQTGKWTLVAQVKDDGKLYGNTPAILDTGYAGMRTDFMDATFSDYSIAELTP